MKTEWLEWLVALRKYGSLQKVSDICHVTPQNIGKMFNHLEEEMGIELFDRNSKKLKLNQAGEELADASAEIIETLNEIKNKYSKNQPKIQGSLELVSPNSAIFQDIMDSFLKIAPDVVVSYTEMGYEEAFGYINHHPQALAFVPIWQNKSFNEQIKNYEQYCTINTLFKDEQVLFVSEKSPLAKAKNVF